MIYRNRHSVLGRIFFLSVVLTTASNIDAQDRVEVGLAYRAENSSASVFRSEASVGLVATQAQDLVFYDHGNPTDFEQLMLELVNRARNDPGVEAARLGIGLNDGLIA